MYVDPSGQGAVWNWLKKNVFEPIGNAFNKVVEAIANFEMPEWGWTVIGIVGLIAGIAVVGPIALFIGFDSVPGATNNMLNLIGGLGSFFGNVIGGLLNGTGFMSEGGIVGLIGSIFNAIKRIFGGSNVNGRIMIEAAPDMFPDGGQGMSPPSGGQGMIALAPIGTVTPEQVNLFPGQSATLRFEANDGIIDDANNFGWKTSHKDLKAEKISTPKTQPRAKITASGGPRMVTVHATINGKKASNDVYVPIIKKINNGGDAVAEANGKYAHVKPGKPEGTSLSVVQFFRILGEIKPSLLSANYYYVEMGNGNKRFVKKNDVMLVTHGYGGGYMAYPAGKPARPNCLGYILFRTEDIHLISDLTSIVSSDYETDIKKYIENNTYTGKSFVCRPIASYNTAIYDNEYRIAFRIGVGDDGKTANGYHFIMQLSDGTWAGKNDTLKSYHFTGSNINPRTHKNVLMWNSKVPENVGTIFFAVERLS